MLLLTTASVTSTTEWQCNSNSQSGDFALSSDCILSNGDVVIDADTTIVGNMALLKRLPKIDGSQTKAAFLALLTAQRSDFST